MFRKAFISTVFLCSIIAAGSVAAVAQLGPVSGRVVITGADGKDVGVPNALIDLYRVDVKGTLPSGHTDKNGNFAFAGVPFGGTYVIAVSAPKVQPQYFRGIKAGNDQLYFRMIAGGGERFTEEQVRQGAAAAPQGTGQTELTAEQKKQQAEYEQKKKQVEEANAKITKATEVIQASFTAGNEAFKTKNYDLAIQKYDEGIAADPEFIGSVTPLSNNRGVAYMYKALDERNKAIQATDATAKAEGLTKAKQDFDESVNSFLKSWKMLKAGAPSAEFPQANYDATKMGALTGARDALQLVARTELVDQTSMDAANLLIPEYLAVETDAAKKTGALLIVADMHRANGEYQAAIDAYKKVLEASPDNPDALAMIGVCYYALGAANNSDKAMYQEGANYLQKYLAVAPEGHKYKKDVAEILDALKKENVTPQKVTTPAKKRGN